MLLLNFVFGTMTDIVGRLFIQWKDVIGKRKERCWNVIIFLQKLSVSALNSNRYALLESMRARERFYFDAMMIAYCSQTC